MKILLLSSKPEVFDFGTANQIIKDYGHESLLWYSVKERADFPTIRSIFDYTVAFSCYYTYKIPAKELSNHLGCPKFINIHPGPLPEMKGRNLCYHAIKDGHKEFGVTAHWCDKDFDTGPIIRVDRFPIEDWMNAGDLSKAAALVANTMFLSLLEGLCRGDAWTWERQPESGTYYPATKIDDFIELDEYQKRMVRAICTSEHPAKTIIGGRTYIIKPEDQQ